MSNPLIDYPDLPPFSEIKPEHVEPAVDALLESNRAKIREVLEQGSFSWK
jgi:oligopeptidase A